MISWFKRLCLLSGMLLAFWWGGGGQVCAAQTGLTEETELTEEILGELKLGEIEEVLKELPEAVPFRFTETVKKLVKGEIPWTAESIGEILKEALLSQIQETRSTIGHLLLLIIVACVFYNFAGVFEKSQVAEISFYMMYLLLFILLMQAFRGLSQLTMDTLEHVLSFMKLLLPAYLAASVFASGSISGWGFYELTLLLILGIQNILRYVILPAANLYVLLSMVNNLTKEEYFSKMAELLRTFTEWSLKTLTAAAVGVQTVQCLILPAVDHLKTTMLHKTAGAIPGIGNALSGVSEVLLGSALLIKNAVGVAGLIFLLLLCAIPFVKLTYCGLLYRLLAALVQPMSDKRIVECIGSVGEGAGLLIRILRTVGVLFFLSVALATATIGG